MRDIWIQKGFAPVKRLLPAAIWQPLRGVLTGLMAPVFFSSRSGHFRSALKRKPVWRDGSPIPWYSYPCLDFLMARDFARARVLEFGGGNSTLWWARRAASVVTIEDDAAWCGELRRQIPDNVSLHYVDSSAADRGRAAALALVERSAFDVVIIDGLDRPTMVEVALLALSPTGALVCDNAEGYGFFELLRGKDLRRVDFYGYVPGVVNPHSTSVYFRDGCLLFSSEVPIFDMLDLRA